MHACMTYGGYGGGMGRTNSKFLAISSYFFLINPGRKSIIRLAFNQVFDFLVFTD